MSGIKRNKS